MRIAVTHTSFAVYWPARLARLASLARDHGSSIHLIAVTADAGPYTFAPASASSPELQWETLFGDANILSLRPSTIARRLWGALDELNPDVVVAGAIAFTPGATAVRWARKRRRGVVIMDDARREDVPRSKLVNAIKQRVYSNVDAMLVPAPSHASTCESFGLSRSRVFFGLDVIDNDYFWSEASRCRREKAHDVNGIPLPGRFFLGVGRQVPKKNWLTLIDAYARYRKSTAGEPWELVLVGDGPERPAIEHRVGDNGVAGVHLLPFLPPHQMPLVYANAQCVILPSVYGETWGLVINEAMASGRPVLVSQECGCAATLVEPGGNGWTFCPHGETDLTTCLARMAALEPAALRRMGERSRQIISGWSLDRFARGALDAIRACADVRRGFAGPLDRALLSLWKGRFRPN